MSARIIVPCHLVKIRRFFSNKKLSFSVRTCSGICMAERIADYCDAVLNVESLCKTGYRCCVSRDAFGDSPPPELVVIDRTKSNGTRHEEKTATNSTIPGKGTVTTTRPSGTTRPPVVSSTITTTTTEVTSIRPKPAGKPCKGECINGLFALFCDNIDVDAECPGDDSCCIQDVAARPVK